jgi:excisionase family DNA binding protein
MTARLTTRAAARRLGVCVRTVLRMIRRGDLVAVRLGRGRYLIDEAALALVFTPAGPASPPPADQMAG